MVGNKTRSAGLAAAVLGVAIAGATLAQTPDPANKASVDAWKTSNSILEKTANPVTGWQSIAATPDGLLMRGVLAQRDASSGQASVALRIEFFKAGPGVGGIQALSELDTFTVDCVGARIKQVQTASFPAHNLGGDKKTQLNSEDWSPAASVAVLEGSVRAACAAASGPGRGGAVAAAPGAAGARPGPTFNINDQAAGRRWLTEQAVLQGGTAGNPDWPLLGFGTDGALFRSAKPDSSKGTRSTPRYILRQEFYGPVTTPTGTALSQSTDYDINCQRGQIRKVSVTLYASRNLAGQSTTTLTPGDFVPVASDPVMKSAIDDICRDADKAIESGAGKFLR